MYGWQSWENDPGVLCPVAKHEAARVSWEEWVSVLGTDDLFLALHPHIESWVGKFSSPGLEGQLARGASLGWLTGHLPWIQKPNAGRWQHLYS